MAYTTHEENRKIKILIDLSGIKHKDLCIYLKLSKAGLSKRYNGHYRWKTEELRQLATIIGCSFYDLI